MWITRRRAYIVVFWSAASVAGLVAWASLGNRLNDSLSVPHSQSWTAAVIVKDHFHEPVEGSFLVLFDASAERWTSRGFMRRVDAAAKRAAHAVDGRVGPSESISAEIVSTPIITEMSPPVAQRRVTNVEAAVGRVPGATITVTGYPVVTRDLSHALAQDLRQAEVISGPATLII